jgi:hypothetical protein
MIAILHVLSMHPLYDSQPSTVSYDEVSCLWQFRSSPKYTMDVYPEAQSGFTSGKRVFSTGSYRFLAPVAQPVLTIRC